MSATLIEVSGLTYDYPGRRALSGLSFSVLEGTITSVVGPNGAGKTTLLRCLAALTTPVDGVIRVAGLDTCESPRECHALTGFVADFYGLYDSMKVSDYLLFFAHARRAGGDPAARVSNVLARLGLADRAGERVRTLSRGMRQRLAIAQAIVHGPKLLLLDEPASGLDPEARHNLALLLRQLRDEGMTIVVSSHILAELDAYSTDVMIMRQGTIVEHKPLIARGAAAERVRIATHPPGEGSLDAALVGAVGVTDVSREDGVTLCTVEGGPEAAVALLKRLVEAGVPVAAFGPAEVSLEAEYMKHVKGAGHE